MIESTQKRIGDNTYSINHLPPKKSIRVLTKIIKTVAAPLMRGLNGSDSKKKSLLDVDINFDGIADGLINGLDEDSVIGIIESLLDYVEIKKEGGFAPVSIEVDFQGNLMELFEVVKESLVHNYSDVLKKNLALIPKGKAMKKSTSKSTKKN